jgi:NADH:ubiquinone oxidoreductase subunit E
MKINICIGSSCHLKGARQIVDQLQYLIAERQLQESIELAGSFCMGECTSGVCVKMDDKMFSLEPGETKSFFEEEVLSRL